MGVKHGNGVNASETIDCGLSALAMRVFSCQNMVLMSASTEITQEIYGKLADGREVKLFTLTNKNGLVAKVMEYGAILTSMEVPDAAGQLADLTLGFDSLEGWLSNSSYYGATAGRFGNRIKDAKFTLDGRVYQLAENDGPNHLHGGIDGFNRVLWSGKIVGNDAVEFRYISKAGEEGYPGNLEVIVTYTLTDADELIWHAEATTDAPTPVNLVHHTYWNLSGDFSVPITDHEILLNADHYLPTDAGMIPTGEIAPVLGTPLDFTSSMVIGDRINQDFEALNLAGGYDHAWVLREGQVTRLAARLADPKSGRVMEVLTNQPAVQFYAGNKLSAHAGCKGGIRYIKQSGLCLETEGFPDAPNHSHFPSSILRPGEQYSHLLIHRFQNPLS